MKTLYSLGDSYMSTDDPDEGIVSFCELYSRAKNFEHVSLARPGATNFATRLQIDRAIKDRADYVVIGRIRRGLPTLTIQPGRMKNFVNLCCVSHRIGIDIVSIIFYNNADENTNLRQCVL